MITIIYFFLGTALAQVKNVVDKVITDAIVEGPCDVSNVATINSNHMNLGDTAIDLYDRFMIYGWFKAYSTPNQLNNLLFIVPNSADTLNQYLLAVTLDQTAKASTCVSATECASITIGEFNPKYMNPPQLSFVLDYWTFVMAGADIARQRIHLKVVIYLSSFSVPEVYSRTLTHNLQAPWTAINLVSIKNKLTNSFGLNPFCGKVQRMRWFAGLYLEDNSANIDLQATLKMIWAGQDASSMIVATNQLTPYRNQGKYGGANLFSPTQDAVLGVGILYGKGEVISYTSSKDVFGSHFIISFWFKANMDQNSPNIPVFTRRSSTDQLLQIRLIYDSSDPMDMGINIAVVVNGALAPNHGQFRLACGTFYRVTLVFFTQFNNNPPQTQFHLIVSPTKANYYVVTLKTYVDANTDTFFIGDQDNVSTWDNGEVHLHDFRVYSGAYFTVHDTATPPLMGCHLSVSAYNTHCLACNNFMMAASDPDTYGACAASLSPTTAVGQYTYCPWGQYYTANADPACTDGQIRGCVIYTDVYTCKVCAPPNNLIDNSCNAPKTFTIETDQLLSDLPLAQAPNICGIGIQLCQLKDGALETISECKVGYYLDTSNPPNKCTLCDPTCYSCLDGVSCSLCLPNMYLQPSTQLCAPTCQSPLFTDMVNLKCVVACDKTKLFSIDDPLNSIYSCVSVCPGNYVPSGKDCVQTCPIATYMFDGQCYPCAPECLSCYGPLNIQCNVCTTGYYLETTKCDTFCLDATLYRDDITVSCIVQCPDPPAALVIAAELRCVKECPTTPVLYYQYVNDCLPECPTRTYPIQTGLLYSCGDCDPSCKTCSGSGSNQCSVCMSGFFLDSTSCPDKCTDVATPWADSVNNMCQAVCPINALVFSPTKECLAICPSTPINYYSHQGQCVDQCPTGAFPYASSCITCNVACTTCFGGKATQCTVCSTGYYLYNTTCYLKCPSDKRYADETTVKCVSSCPIGTYTVPDQNACLVACPSNYTKDLAGLECIQQCPAGQYQAASKQCKTCDPACGLCSDATRTQCTKCNANFYLDGTRCDDKKCLMHPNYLRAQFLWQCVDSCTKGMYESIDAKMCVNVCPSDLYVLNMKCYSVCQKGYYGDNNTMTCIACTKECLECLDGSSNNCSVCAETYYLEETSCTLYCSTSYYKNSLSFECLKDCPSNLLRYQDGAGSKSCVEACPASQYEHIDKSCYTICPEGYYGNTENGQCDICSLECFACTAFGNQYCNSCADNYTKTGNACVGTCPNGYFPQPTGCQVCAFRCETCVTNQYNCLLCRGDRQNLPMCNCQEGYFDDGVSDTCQSCVAPCITCSSLSFCITCPFNTSPPSCLCQRKAPIKSDWCVSCKVSFPSILFSDDLSQLRIEFGYEINVNSVDPYVASNDNCKTVFQAATLKQLGSTPTCQINQNTPTYILVNLDIGVTVNLGDTVLFNNEAVQDFSLGSCKTQYLTTFMTSTVQAPLNPPTPGMQFKYPSMVVSACLPVSVYIAQQLGNGPRSLARGPWTVVEKAELGNPSKPVSTGLDGIKAQLKEFNQNSSDYFTLPANLLEKNTIYHFSIDYKNILGIEGSSSLQLSIGDDNTPSVQIQLSEYKSLVNYMDVEVPLQIQSLECSKGRDPKDSKDSYRVSLLIMDMVTGAVVLNKNAVDDGKRIVTFTIPAFSTSPGNEVRLNASIIGKSDTSKKAFHSIKVTVANTQIDAYFLTKDRVIGSNVKQVNISVEAFDPGVSNKQFKYTGINFYWECVNLLKQQSCRDSSSLTLTFPSRPWAVIDRKYLQANTTYQFYVNVSKDDISTLISQQLIVVDDPIGELWFQSSHNNLIDLTVQPYDLLSVIYNPPLSQSNGSYVLMVYDFEVKFFTLVQQSTLNFKVQDYENTFAGSQLISLYFTGYNDFRRIMVLQPQKAFSFQVSPSSGGCLKTFFRISVDLQDSTADSKQFKYQFFLYVDDAIFDLDQQEYSIDHAYQLSDVSSKNFITTVLPAPTSASGLVYIVARVTGLTGQISLVHVSVPIDFHGAVNQRKNLVLLSSFLTGLSKFDDVSKLKQINHAIAQLISRDSLACGQGCGGKGLCIPETEVCMCDTDWYLSDCSGGINDLAKVTTLTKLLVTTITQLTASKQITSQPFLMNMLTRCQASLYDSPYFYNTLLQLDNYAQVVGTVLDFVTKKTSDYEAQYKLSQKSRLELMTLAQSHTLSGVNVYLQPSPSIPADQTNSLITILTSLFQQNAVEYLRSSALVGLVGNTSNSTSKAQSKVLETINKRMLDLLNKLLGYQASSMATGSTDLLIVTPTVHIDMIRNFWSEMSEMHSKYVIGSDQLLATRAKNETVNSSESNSAAKSEAKSKASGLRILGSKDNKSVEPVASSLYDYRLVKFVMNPYRLVKDFAYPMSGFPVYELQITETATGTAYNGSLVNNYMFDIDTALINQLSGFRQYNSSIVIYNDDDLKQFNNSTESEPDNYVCIWLDVAIGNWSLCENFTVSNVTRKISCTCIHQAPVTSVNDLKYLYKPQIVEYVYTLDQFNLVLAVGILTGLWILASLVGMWRDRRLHDVIIPQMSGFAGMLVKRKDDEGHKHEEVSTLNMNAKVQRRDRLQSTIFMGQPKQGKDDSINEDLARQMATRMTQAKQKAEQDQLVNVWGSSEQSSPFESAKPSFNNSVVIDQDENSSPARIRRNARDQTISSPLKTSDSPTKAATIIKPVPVVALARASHHGLLQFHRNHSLFSICFKFQKDVGRGFRFTYFYARLLLMFTISGMLSMIDVSMGINIAAELCVSSVLRFVSVPLRTFLVRSRSTKEPSCCYRFATYTITAGIITSSGIMLAILYFSLPETANYNTLYSWICSIAIDLTALDIVIELFLRISDYMRKLATDHADRQNKEDEEEDEEDEEEEPEEVNIKH